MSNDVVMILLNASSIHDKLSIVSKIRIYYSDERSLSYYVKKYRYKQNASTYG